MGVVLYVDPDGCKVLGMRISPEPDRISCKIPLILEYYTCSGFTIRAVPTLEKINPHPLAMFSPFLSPSIASAQWSSSLPAMC